METEVKISPKLSITLSVQEATLLRGVMQNPLFDVHPDDEELALRELRINLFTACKLFLDEQELVGRYNMEIVEQKSAYL